MKYLDVEQELRRLLARSKWAPHARFFSESEVRAQFDVSRDTAQKALSGLEQSGLIYTKPRSGSFVSGTPRPGKILFLFSTSFDEIGRNSLLGHYDPFTFYLAMDETNQKQGWGYELLIQNNIGDPQSPLVEKITRVPDLRAVVVFRDIARLREARVALGPLAVPLLFYGSDTHQKELGACPSLTYREKKVVGAALGHLYEKGHRKIACFTQNWPAGQRRKSLYLAWMAQKKLPVDPRWLLERDGYQVAAGLPLWFKKLKKENRAPTALFSTIDSAVLREIQPLTDAGVAIPQDLALVGVDHLPQGDLIKPRLTSVEIPVAEDGRNALAYLHQLIQKKRPKPILDSTPRLIPGETT